MTERFFEVGKIANTHGVRGELKIFTVTDFPEERYRKGSQLYIDHPSLKEKLPVTVETARPQKNTYIIKFKEFHNINDVEKYKGGTLLVNETDREELDNDEFYYEDILGCTVITDQGESLGVVEDILETGANDVWVVKTATGKEVLLPYIDDCILEIDIEQKKITAHIMEGLL